MYIYIFGGYNFFLVNVLCFHFLFLKIYCLFYFLYLNFISLFKKACELSYVCTLTCMHKQPP